MVGALENGEPFLLLGHPLKQSSVRLLYSEHLPLERDDLSLVVRLGLLLCFQSLLGHLERSLGLRQVGLRRIEFLLGNSRLLDRT